jgi:nucleoside-diphosphate-sugar epimerase
MRILVTGGLGFVGINVVRYLAQALEAQVIAADVLTPDPLTQVFLNPVAERVRIVHLDMTDRAAFRQLVQTEAVTHIIHAAAITPDDRRERQQASFIVDVNLGGAINALDVALESPSVERLLLCSSSGVYGASPGASSLVSHQPEDGRLQLDNLYAITKHSAELLAIRYAELSGKAMASVRLAAIYGPMERPTGSREQMSHVWRLRAALETGRPVQVAGPEVLRDWTYTLDMGEAIRALLCAPRWRHTIYNVSCGQAATFRQVVEAFVADGLCVEWVQDPDTADIAMRPSQARAPLDISRLQSDTGFIPRYDLATGLADCAIS